MKKRNPIISVFGSYIIGFMVVIFSLSITTGCNNEPISTNNNIIENYIVISDPTNQQICNISAEITGSCYSDITIESVKIFATPNYGGITNEWDAETQNNRITIYRKLLNFPHEAYYYLWTEMSNQNGDVEYSDLLLIYVQE